MFITFIYCLFIYFMAKTNIKFHILSFGIYAPWNFLIKDWILVFGQKSLVQWENDTHKHTYIELIARLRTKKDDMTIKKEKTEKKDKEVVWAYTFLFSLSTKILPTHIFEAWRPGILKLKISMLMQTTYLWNNHHQEYSKN
jgi:hypothetical protein